MGERLFLSQKKFGSLIPPTDSVLHSQQLNIQITRNPCFQNRQGHYMETWQKFAKCPPQRKSFQTAIGYSGTNMFVFCSQTFTGMKDESSVIFCPQGWWAFTLEESQPECTILFFLFLKIRSGALRQFLFFDTKRFFSVAIG
ncbi:hypothetical protein CEXT_731311 [Caerostris extrusa]|uniref:Uncharacterized protein n=1 Tax=Caerostris extrusa TaxID=172846 RepID=A0AAV4X647_CAEEX|nr:hypothetical protein CEXT_731311 [Caerostris extrusa]